MHAAAAAASGAVPGLGHQNRGCHLTTGRCFHLCSAVRNPYPCLRRCPHLGPRKAPSLRPATRCIKLYTLVCCSNRECMDLDKMVLLCLGQGTTVRRIQDGMFSTNIDDNAPCRPTPSSSSFSWLSSRGGEEAKAALWRDWRAPRGSGIGPAPPKMPGPPPPAAAPNSDTAAMGAGGGRGGPAGWQGPPHPYPGQPLEQLHEDTYSLKGMLLSHCSPPHLPFRHPASMTPAEQPFHPPHWGLPLAAQCRTASAPVLLSACRHNSARGLRKPLQPINTAGPGTHISNRKPSCYL